MLLEGRCGKSPMLLFTGHFKIYFGRINDAGDLNIIVEYALSLVRKKATISFLKESVDARGGSFECKQAIFTRLQKKKSGQSPAVAHTESFV